MVDVVQLAIAGHISELSITLPTLRELAVPDELMDAAEMLVSCSDLEDATLELLVRLLVYQDRQGWLARNPDLAKLIPRAG